MTFVSDDKNMILFLVDKFDFSSTIVKVASVITTTNSDNLARQIQLTIIPSKTPSASFVLMAVVGEYKNSAIFSKEISVSSSSALEPYYNINIQ